MKKYQKYHMMNYIKILTIFLISVLIFSGCGNNKENSIKDNADDKELFTIVTSFYPMYVFTVNIIKDIKGVRVLNMTEPQTGCLHDYQLVPADIRTLEKADVFVINGAGMETFIDKVVRQLPDLKIIEASRGIGLVKSTSESEKNAHVWVSIPGAVSEVRNISGGLAAADPAHAASYEKNAGEYIEKLETLKNKMHMELANITKRDIVTFHEAFSYFAQEFGLNVVSVVEREPGSEPSAGEIANIIKLIKKTGVRVIFAEPQYSSGIADSIATQTGAKLFFLDPVVTGPKKAAPDSYIKTMEENLKTLLRALK